MKKNPAAMVPGPSGAVIAKKPYVSPVLHTYGKLHHVTQGSLGNGTDAVNMAKMSDRTTKENIVRVGSHPLGIGLYLFDYKPEFRGEWGHGRQFGVLAQEVETVMPEAVTTHPDSYRMVNYAMLGITHSTH